MKSILSAVSVVAISVGSASAASFQFLSYEAGGGVPGIVGEGFSTTSGDFWNGLELGQGIGSPSIALFGTFPELEFDTYVTIDAVGPSSDVHQANTTATASAVIFGTGSVIQGDRVNVGVGIAPQPFFSGIAPDGNDGVFVLRATVPAGESVVGGGFFAISAEADGATLGRTVSIGGGGVDFEGQPLGLVTYLAATDAENGAAMGDTYDVWFQLIPSPGALALLGVGGLTVLRRRR